MKLLTYYVFADGDTDVVTPADNESAQEFFALFFVRIKRLRFDCIELIQTR